MRKETCMWVVVCERVCELRMCKRAHAHSFIVCDYTIKIPQ